MNENKGDDFEQNLITELKETLSESKTTLTEIKKEYDSVEDIINSLRECENSLNEIRKFQSEYKIKAQEVQNNLQISGQLFSKISDLAEKSKDKDNKLNLLLQNFQSDQEKIKKFNDQLFGTTGPNNKHISGIKDNLDVAYNKLESDFSELKTNFDGFKSETDKEFQKFISESEQKRELLINEIRSHLPDAVAAGLSGTYRKKAADESNANKLNLYYFIGILVIIFFIACAPLLLCNYLMNINKSVEEIINILPYIYMLSFPLYIPFIWIGIHFNKKINLGRKLHEEYSYKAVISEAITGLSEQIKNIKNDDFYEKIYEKLILLIITASEDNPSKYIRQYDKIDNPLLEILSNPKKIKEIMSSCEDFKELMNNLVKRSKEDSGKNQNNSGK